MRAFVGTLLDAAGQHRCRRVIDGLVEASGGRLRPIPADTAHLTWAFIAALPEDRADPLAHALTGAAARLSPVSITFGAPQVLYGGREARLVHLPVAHSAALDAVASRVGDAVCVALPGIDVKRGGSPHVTLARFRRGTRRRDARPVEDVLARLATLPPAAITIGALQLVESRLGPTGPEYLVRASLSLEP